MRNRARSARSFSASASHSGECFSYRPTSAVVETSAHREFSATAPRSAATASQSRSTSTAASLATTTSATKVNATRSISTSRSTSASPFQKGSSSDVSAALAKASFASRAFSSAVVALGDDTALVGTATVTSTFLGAPGGATNGAGGAFGSAGAGGSGGGGGETFGLAHTDSGASSSPRVAPRGAIL